MKLVETDTEGPDRDTPDVSAPRPEHRRVAVSAVLTILVLVGTVVTIYMVFPKRDNQLMTRAHEFHRTSGSYDLDQPKREQLATFALGILGKVPWPDDKLKIIGVTSGAILDFPAVMVRYEIGGRAVSLVVQRARDTPPRRHTRTRGDHRSESWRVQKWTFVAVGPAKDPDDWQKAIGVP